MFLLGACVACTHPLENRGEPLRAFVAVLQGVDTMHGPPFRTLDQTCATHRAVSEILYDSLIFDAQGQLERHFASRGAIAQPPDSALTWGDPQAFTKAASYEVTDSTVIVYWPCFTCGSRDNAQTFRRVDSTALVYPFGAIGGACLDSGGLVNSTAREVPFAYAVSYLPTGRLSGPADR